ncbi:MAG: hypothetical protein QQN41_00130 [Nitrosopumilus sp.]
MVDNILLKRSGIAVDANQVDTDTSNFDGKLSNADDEVQKALDTLDDHNHTEDLTHADLSDMPDTGGTNTDHDARYYTETEIDTMLSDGTIDHITDISNVGTNTHAQIDTHLALTNEHIDWTNATENLTTTGKITVGIADGTLGLAVKGIQTIDAGEITGSVLTITGESIDFGVGVQTVMNFDLLNTGSKTGIFVLNGKVTNEANTSLILRGINMTVVGAATAVDAPQTRLGASYIIKSPDSLISPDNDWLVSGLQNEKGVDIRFENLIIAPSASTGSDYIRTGFEVTESLIFITDSNTGSINDYTSYGFRYNKPTIISEAGISGAINRYAFHSNGEDWAMQSDNTTFSIGATLTDFQLSSDGTNGIINVATSLRLGNPTTNYTEINSTGNLVFVGSAGLCYGEISVKDNATTTTLNSAAKTQITIFDTNGLSNNATSEHANDHIIILKAGVYDVVVPITVKNGAGSSHKVKATLWKNNGSVEFPNVHQDRDLSAGTDVGSMTLAGKIAVVENDRIEVWAETDRASDSVVTFEDITLSLTQIGGG